MPSEEAVAADRPLNSYWLTFRISGDDAAGRTRRLASALRGISSDEALWDEPPAFFIFESPLPIAEVRALVEAAIDPATDMAIIGMLYFMKWEIVGTVRDPAVFRSLKHAGVF